jgi:hypothetical protein
MPGRSFVASSYTLLMPVFAEDILNGGPRVFGYLMSATGVGALAGAIFLASRRRLKGLGETIVITGILYGVDCSLCRSRIYYPSL